MDLQTRARELSGEQMRQCRVAGVVGLLVACCTQMAMRLALLGVGSAGCWAVGSKAVRRLHPLQMWARHAWAVMVGTC